MIKGNGKCDVKNYETAQPFRKKEINGKLRREDNGSAKVAPEGPYFVRDGSQLIVNEMARAVDGIARRILVAGFASRLVEHFNERTIKL